MKQKQLCKENKGGWKRASAERLRLVKDSEAGDHSVTLKSFTGKWAGRTFQMLKYLCKSTKKQMIWGRETQWPLIETEQHAADKQHKCPAWHQPVFWEVAAGALDWWAENYNIGIWQKVFHIRGTGAKQKNESKSESRWWSCFSWNGGLVKMIGPEEAEKVKQISIHHTAPDWFQSYSVTRLDSQTKPLSHRKNKDLCYRWFVPHRGPISKIWNP